MDCDARRQQLIRDLDGSFTGSVGGTVISKAEYQWDGNKRYGLGTICCLNITMRDDLQLDGKTLSFRVLQNSHKIVSIQHCLSLKFAGFS